jgi:hypothetical protein
MKMMMATTMMMMRLMMAPMTSLMELSVVDIQTGFHPLQVSVVTQCVVPLTVVRIVLRGLDMTMNRVAAAYHVRT